MTTTTTIMMMMMMIVIYEFEIRLPENKFGDITYCGEKFSP